MKTISVSDIKPMLSLREPDSHKGQNGRILIIGGHSEFSGAHVLSGMGALYSGCDLVRLFVPECNVAVARGYCPEFIVRGYRGDSLKPEFLKDIEDFIKDSDCVVVGPGSKPEEDFLQAVKELLQSNLKFVLDSNAIPALSDSGKNVLITPHKAEFERFFGKEEINDVAKKHSVNVLLKGQVDLIASASGEVVANKTGNAGMTVGGSGDVLAGLCGGFMAQGLKPFDAGKLATFLLGKAGDTLKMRKDFCYTAKDLAEEIPYTIGDCR